jgi:hypothetical protein
MLEVHLCMCVRMLMFICMHINVCIYMWVYVCKLLDLKRNGEGLQNNIVILEVHLYTYIHLCICISIHLYVCTYECMDICMYICIDRQFYTCKYSYGYLQWNIEG